MGLVLQTLISSDHVAPLPMRPTSFFNAHLISPGVDRPDSTVVVDDGLITAISEKSEGDFDVEGNYLVPGFIDIHTHGAGGASAMDGTEEAVRTMSETKLKEGVTSFCPTTWTESEENLVRAMSGIAQYMKRQDFARTPFVHVEGPFISPDFIGAQNPDYVRPPDILEIDRLNEIAKVGIVSLAVEMSGGVEFVREATDRGIATSLAHTGATYAEFLEARKAGLKHLTHFCNQMTKLHHREIGIVGAGLLDDEIRLEMICDKIHLSPEMIELTFKHKPVHQVMLITDSISASWFPDGEYEEGGQTVLVQDGVCRLQSGALAGSTLRYDRGFKHVAEISGKPLSELIQTTSWNQAQSLGLEKVGKIEPGFAADLVILDRESLSPLATIVGGEVKYEVG
ncbi:MAG: N-acetylglucosamine-6-phosphate deacetylase [Verrucomicrobiota bacterium]